VKLEGRYTFSAAPADVWNLLTDPSRLEKCLPGCDRLVPDGPDRFKATVKFALAAISSAYAGRVELLDKKPPKSLRLRMEGKGAPGFVKAEGSVELSETRGGTELRYSGEAQVGGLIATVGQRLIESAARKIVAQFFDNAASQLQSS
jgi:hypothetical protein